MRPKPGGRLLQVHVMVRCIGRVTTVVLDPCPGLLVLGCLWSERLGQQLLRAGDRLSPRSRRVGLFPWLCCQAVRFACCWWGVVCCLVAVGESQLPAGEFPAAAQPTPAFFASCGPLLI